MRKQVVIKREVTTDELTSTKGYAMVGNKGVFIATKQTDGRYVFVRAEKGHVGKPIHAFDTLKELIENKIEKGYEVFEYDTLDELI